jgi:predicted dienelactone hydrolase
MNIIFKISVIATSFFINISILSQSVELPPPSGEHSIGTFLLKLTDSTRNDPFIDYELKYRELTAKVWYPAYDNQKIEYENYFGKNESLQNVLKVNNNIFELKTNSKQNLRIVEGEEKFPVLIFNHGWGEHFLQNTILMEELSSNGFVVFSLAHHYECKFSIYPDNTLFILNPAMNSKRFQNIMAEQTDSETMEVFRKMFTANGTEEQNQVFQKANELLPVFFTESPSLWSEDVSFLIDNLINVNKNRFNGLLDLERIGVLGMSMGGIAAQQVCIDDDRVKAGLSMDGGFYGESYSQNIMQPFMFINSYRYEGYEQYFLDHLSGSGYVVSIPTADHYNFHDVSIMDSSHPMLGKIDSNRFLYLLNKIVLSFFDMHLKNYENHKGEKLTINFPEITFACKVQY